MHIDSQLVKELRVILAQSITKIAYQACLNGESGMRSWPPLSELTEKESWQCIGDKYAPEIADEIFAALLIYLVKEGEQK